MTTKITEYLWRPTLIPGCQMWLDGADISTMSFSGSYVTQWRDKTGRANHMNPVSSYGNGQLQTAYQNGLNVVNFSGSNVYTAPVNSGVYPLDAYIVIALKSPLTRCDVLSVNTGTSTDNFNSLTFGEYTANRWHNGSTNFSRTPNTVSPTNETSTNFLIMNWSIADNNFIIRRNGTQLSQTASYTWTMSSGSVFQIGWRATNLVLPPDVALSAYIAEIVVFNSQLGTTPRQQIEGYLAGKWGLQASLENTHPFRFNRIYTSSAYPRPVPYIAPKPAFDPTSLGNCALWLDAADPTTISLAGNSVTRWRDKSANRFLFTGAGGTQPTYTSTLNGQRVISSASGQKLTTTGWNQNFSLATIFALIRPTQNITVDYQGYPIFRRVTGTGTIQFDVTYANQSGYYYYLQTWTNTSFMLQASLNNSPSFNPTNLPLLLTSVVNNSTNNIARYNGTNLSPVLNSANTFPTLSGVTLDIIGGADARGFDVAEIIVFGAALTLQQYQQIEGYLSWKWGVTMPPGHAYAQQVILPFPYASRRITTKFWQPTVLPNCALWLDAADISTFSRTGQTITQWRDKSGNFNDATAFNSPFLSSNSINLYQSVESSSTSYFTGSLSITGTGLTAFAIAKTRATLPLTGSDQRLISLANTTNADFGRTDGAIVLFNQGGSSSIASWRVSGPLAANTIVTNVPFLATSQFDGTNAYLWLNGNPGSSPSSASSGTFSITKYGIGNQANATSEYWRGNIGEIIIFSSSLTTQQRQQVEGYLAWKWGLQANLPATHPFSRKPTPPTPAPTLASGGTKLVANNTTYHLFTTSGTFTVISGGTVNYLVVGGGGGGGDRHGGGGGAGGVLSGTFGAVAQSYTVTVGTGGTLGNYEGGTPPSPQGVGQKGGDSSIATVATAFGGGGGGTYDGNPSGVTVGSGGGGGGNGYAGVAGTAGQGNSGGSGAQPAGGGGGGAGGAGANANTSTGGIGTTAFSSHLLAVGYGTTFATSPNNPVSGGVAYIAGGGGGAADNGGGSTARAGGLGGGGTGDWDDAVITAGTANTGGGGGASRSSNTGTTGRNGGSGLVLIWY